MQAVIFSFLFIAIVLGSLWYHDVRHPPEEQAMQTERSQNVIKDGIANQLKEQPVEVLVATKR